MIATLHIQTVLRNGRTSLAKAYTTSPLKVADITEDKNGGQLDLMLMSSSPGILDGDDYRMKIEVAPGCRMSLQTQSYQRLFTMAKGACQTMEVHIGKGASFCCIPHPTVPHTGSVYKALNKIYLSADSNLIWGEIITCGRKLSGEQFRFSKLHILTDVFLNDKLIIKENLLVEPGKNNIAAVGHWEGYTHHASLLFISNTESLSRLMEEVNGLLTNTKNIMYGISLAPVNGLVIRILGTKGEQLFDCLKTISLLLLQPLNNPIPVYAS